MPEVQNLLQRKIETTLDENVQIILTILEKNGDLIRRDFTLTEGNGPSAVIFYIDGLSSNQSIDDGVLRPLIVDSLLRTLSPTMPSLRNEAEGIQNAILTNPEIKSVDTFDSAINGLLSGESLIFIDGDARAWLAGTKGWESRSPGETATEVVVRGPRDGFTENIRTNTSLIRRRIKDPMFRLESLKIGEKTQTAVNIAYIEGTVKSGLVDEVLKRLKSIQIDAILESGYVQELIEDAPLSPFPTVRSTERPDTAAAAILEGHVAILVDTTPFVLIVPTYFWDGLMASDDYYSRFLIGTFSRFVRYAAFIISLTLPSFYVMLVSFHQEMIPTQLALNIAAGRETVPFPVLVEVLLMEGAFELMREAGLRMPRPVGQAVSIVGSLIIGQAAVQAGLVSPVMVIVVAVTGLSSFAIPAYETSFSIRLLRFPILFVSGTLGLLGFMSAVFIIAVHALSLRSFGEPYLAPVVPARPSDQKDNLIRFPWWAMRRRPWMSEDDQRLGSNQKPQPPKSTESGGDSDSPKLDDSSSPNTRNGRRRKRRPRKIIRET